MLTCRQTFGRGASDFCLLDKINLKQELYCSFVTIWMNLECIMLSKISQRKKYSMISLICEIYKKRKKERNKMKTDSWMQRTNGWLQERRGEGGFG